jgi:hypothetical protein
VTVRLHDQAVVLEPDTRVDRYTDTPEADWSKPPVTETPTPILMRPLNSFEAVATAETVVSRWRAYLGPAWDGVLTPAHRIRWDGDDYEIDGAVERHKTRSCVRYITVTLKLAKG